MNCSEVQSTSPLYLSRELDTERADLLAAHLKRCPACAQEIQRQSELDNLLRASVAGEPVDSAALERRIRAEIAPSSHRWIWASAAIAAAVLIAVMLYRPTPRLYADAALDHRDEIRYKQPRKWLTGTAAIETLAQSQQVPPDALAALSRAGYRLERAKLCRLDGRRYMHLVYSNGSREFSVFLHQGAVQPDMKNGRIDAASASGEYVACFETKTFTAVFVADDSRQTAVDLARSTAAVL